MTGYGRSRRERGEASVEVELRSVNGRYLSVKCRLPAEFVRLEPQLEALVKKRLDRGNVDVHTRVRTARKHVRPQIDEDVLAVYQRAAQDLEGVAGVDGATLLSLPGVVTLVEEDGDGGVVDRLVLAAAREATAELDTARSREGERLALAMTRELQHIDKLLASVERRVPAIVRDQHAQLHKRLSALLEGQTVRKDDAVLLREVALLADRTDVTEEIDRLHSHLGALRKTLSASGAVGRRIDFLLQEVGREVNTIGSKCTDVRVAQSVVQLKACVEKLREQAANVE